MDVESGQPVHHAVVTLDDLVVGEHVRGNARELRRDLHAALLVHAAVDGVEQALREVGARTEELHLLARLRRGDAAADRIVITPNAAHHAVVLVLDRRGVDRDLGRVVLERLRQTVRVEDRHVRLGGRSHRLQRMENAVVVLRHHGTSVATQARNRQRRPDGVAGEELVVARDTRELDHAQLHHQMIDEFLRFGLGQLPGLEVTLDVDVKEGRHAADRHRGAVLRLDRSEIAEVGPLHGLLRIGRGLRDVEAVGRGHHLHLL